MFEVLSLGFVITCNFTELSIKVNLPARKLRINFVVLSKNCVIKGFFKINKLGAHAAGCSILKFIERLINFLQSCLNSLRIFFNLSREFFVFALLFTCKLIKISKYTRLNFLHGPAQTLFKSINIGTTVLNLSKLVFNILFVRMKLFINSFKNIKMSLFTFGN